MATTDFTCNKDSRIAVTGSTEMGSGTSDGLPYGTYSGYKYRVLLGFSVNMAGWTSITKAELYYKSSNQIHVAFGSDPTFLAQRISTSWSEGSSDGLSTGNAVIYPGPTAQAGNQVQEDAPTAENTWGAVDVTAMMRDVLNGQPFYGIRLIGSTNASVESASSANVGEIYSRNSGSGTAYLRITYETNRAPDAPTISSPDVANGGLVGTQTPTLNVNMTDPDGNAINNYHWQIDDNADFSSPIQDIYGGAAGASGVTVGVVPAALPRGGTYYFRVQAADVTVWGPWSGTFSFKVAAYPTVTVSEPSASGRLARLTFAAGAGWGSPRMLVNWSLVCPDGGSQSAYQLQIFNDAAGATGSVLYDSNPTSGTTSEVVVPANLVDGNYYHVRLYATCSHGLTVTSPTYRVRARWGVAVYGADMGATPIGSLALTTLDVTDETTGGQGRVVIEFQTTTANTPPSVWTGSIGGAGLNRYFWYAVYLLAWGPSPAVSPTLNQLSITYTTATIIPDKWQFSSPANASGDVSSFVYGTKSLRLKGTGSPHWAWQQVAVAPDTYYMLSGRVQANGPAGTIWAFLDLTTSSGGGEVAYTPEVMETLDFENPLSRRSIPKAWFSGSNTSIYVRAVFVGPVGTTAWFDAIKLEASTVVTPWSPGYVANAVVLDSGGLSIDAANGGIFRLRGSLAGPRDLVEVAPHGLAFGGDTDLYSPAINHLHVNGRDLMVGGSYKNLVRNGGFRHSMQGWDYYNGGDTTGALNLWRNDATWTFRDGDADDWQGTNNPYGTSMSMSSTAPPGSPFREMFITSLPIAVVAGDVYSASAMAGLHRVPSARMSIWYYDAANTFLGGPNSNILRTPDGAKMGGNERGMWDKFVIEGSVAPVGAVRANVVLIMGSPSSDNSSSEYLFLDQVMFNVGPNVGPFSESPDDRSGGLAFPPANFRAIGDRYYRTDRNVEYFWDGSRWLSTTLYEWFVDLTTSPAVSASGVFKYNLMLPRPFDVASGAYHWVWFVGSQLLFWVNGGTALSASHKWYVQMNRTPSDAVMAQTTIDSGQTTGIRALYTPLGAQFDSAATSGYIIVTKTGTPGNLALYGMGLTYRLLG